MLDLQEVMKRIQEVEARAEKAERAMSAPIAISGTACRFPGGANSPEDYWKLLIEGRNAITEVPSDRWSADQYFDPDPDQPGKMSTKWAGFASDIDQFDARLFNIPPKEAAAMDPQHRLILEATFEALERSAFSPFDMSGIRGGVFIGSMTADYAIAPRASGAEQYVDAHDVVGNEGSFLAGRVAYHFGFNGPTMVVRTACSSSLVAIHLACQALRRGECDIAIAGGANIILSPYWHIASSKIRSQAPDGRCKPFDATADGYVRGEGVGVLVLHRLDDALGGPIDAVIMGSAVTHGGAARSLTSPNSVAQVMAMESAQSDAKVTPDRYAFLESHGTGTPLGDAIEMESIGRVFARPSREAPLPVGAAKANIGHLEAAAGIAGVIKAVEVLRHKTVPPNIHFSEPSPEINLNAAKVELPKRSTPLKIENGKRDVAGVNSFGLSGVNAHVVLRAPIEAELEYQAPPIENRLTNVSDGWRLAPVSAGQMSGLMSTKDAISHSIAKRQIGSIDPIVATLQRGRSNFASRAFAVLRHDTRDLGLPHPSGPVLKLGPGGLCAAVMPARPQRRAA